jgi:hypothetical protein
MEQRAQNDGAGRQRIVRTEEQILSILEEYDRSGFNVKEFCEVSEINEATFYSWIKRYRSKPDGEEIKGFVGIEVVPTLVHTRPQLFAEVGNIKLYREVPAEYLKTLLS